MFTTKTLLCMGRLSDDVLNVNLLEFDRLNVYFDYSSVYIRTDVIEVYK